MRKFILKRLLEKYELARAEHPEVKEPEDATIKRLKEFLLTKNILLRDKHGDISFKEFTSYLFKDSKYFTTVFTTLFHLNLLKLTEETFTLAEKKPEEPPYTPTYVIVTTKGWIWNTYTVHCYEKGKQDVIIDAEHIPGLLAAIENQSSEQQKLAIKNYHRNLPRVKLAVLFKAFTTAKWPAPQTAPVAALDAKHQAIKPRDKEVIALSVMPVMGKFFDAKTTANLSATSRNLNAELIKPAYWKDKLIAAGCRRELLESSSTDYQIKNYKALYENILRCSKRGIELQHRWELLCLSGEVGAIQHLKESKQIDEKTQNSGSMTPLHFAFLSGSADAARIALTLPGINPLTTDSDGWNAAHHAFQSGSVEAAQLALTISKIDPLAITERGWNAMHLAFHSGSVETARLALTIPKINRLATTKHGLNAVHLAFRSGSVETAQLALTIPKIDPLAVDNEGENVLHCALRSGSVEAVRLALTIPKIDPFIITEGWNILHFAAIVNTTAEAVIYLRRWLHEKGFTLLPTAKSSGGYDAFWYARKNDKIKHALAAPIEESRPSEKGRGRTCCC